MESYLKCAVALCVVVLLSSKSDAVTTFTPTSGNIAENTATSTVTLTASGGTGTYTFTSDSQSPDLAWFTVAGTGGTTGTITIATGKTIDYEESSLLTGKLYKVAVKVVDTASTPTSVTVTYTYTVTDVNEAPAFTLTDTALAVKLSSPQTGGTALKTVAATDPEGGTVTYTLSDDSNFAVSSVGAVTIKTGVTLTSVVKSVAVYAKDDNATPLTATKYLFVCIGTTCTVGNAAATITGSVLAAMSVLVTLLMKFI